MDWNEALKDVSEQVSNVESDITNVNRVNTFDDKMGKLIGSLEVCGCHECVWPGHARYNLEPGPTIFG